MTIIQVENLFYFKHSRNWQMADFCIIPYNLDRNRTPSLQDTCCESCKPPLENPLENPTRGPALNTLPQSYYQ